MQRKTDREMEMLRRAYSLADSIKEFMRSSREPILANRAAALMGEIEMALDKARRASFDA